ncbi:MAG: hypothetical protein OEY01_14350 [Desulfobulbaceae bacterium]|nr:hypothetical protein [Desulfobulbaceae bacterium]
MGTFKEQMAADAAVFTNPDEFGELVEFGGVSDIPATIEDVDFDAAKHGYDGFNIERKRMFVALADLPELPVPNQQKTLNGEYWTVGPVIDEDGMAEIILERAQS